jgi:hypothetical protein
MKALEKDRSRRYETANGFAVDLQRYLANEPVSAGPPSAGYRLRKWAWRHRVIVGAVGVSAAAVLLVSLAVLAFSNARIGQALSAETKARGDLEQTLDRERRTHNALRMTLVRRHWEGCEFDRARRLLGDCPPDLRDDGWAYLERALRFEPRTLRVFPTARPAVNAVLNADGRTVAGWNQNEVRVHDAATAEPLADFTVPKPATHVLGGTFAASGRRLTVLAIHEDAPRPGYLPVLKVVQVSEWEVPAGAGGAARRTHLAEHPDPVPDVVVLSPDGRLVAAARRQAFWLWDVRAGTVRPLGGAGAEVRYLAFCPESRYLAAACDDNAVRVWDVRSGELLHTAPGYDGSVRVSRHAADYWDLSKEARRFAWGDTPRGEPHSAVKVLDVAAGRGARALDGHRGGVRRVRFSPDGRYLASTGRDRTVILWDAATGREVVTLRGHTDELHTVAFSADGRRLVTTGSDRTVRVWDLSSLD